MKNKKSYILLATALMLLSACGKKGHVHNFSEWTDELIPTCTQEGLKIRTCSCGETEKWIVPANGHTRFADDFLPSCTEGGTTGRTVCSVCGDVVDEGTVIPPLGHNYVSHDYLPTCEQDGLTGSLICSVCGDVENEGTIVPATGHNYNERGYCTNLHCDKNLETELPFNTTDETKYTFTKNGKYYFEVTIPVKMTLSFSLYSAEGTENGYTFYKEDGTKFGENIKGGYSSELTAQKINIVVNVTDYNSAKYFSIKCFKVL